MPSATGWIGVDWDRTLVDDGGRPVPRMLERVRRWLADGRDVRIFTARAVDPESVAAIRAWCLAHLGRALPVTATKDYLMAELWDDRAVQVVPNTGARADGRD